MAIWKRFEVWLLLAFAGLGAAFVLFSQWAHDRSVARMEAERKAAEAEGAARSAEPQLPFAIETARLSPESSGHWLLELQVRYQNDSDSERELTRPFVALENAEGEPIPEFFLALAPRPIVGARSEGTVELRYWLEERHRGSELFLVVGQDRAPLKASPASAGQPAPVVRVEG